MTIAAPLPLGRYSDAQVMESSSTIYYVTTSYAYRMVSWTLVTGVGTLTPINDAQGVCYTDANGVACAKYTPGASSSGTTPQIRARTRA